MSLPPILSERVRGPVAEYRLAVPVDLPWFRGHFPGHPVLPGLVQVEWARQLAERDLCPDGGFQGLRSVKFQRVIQPDCELCLHLEARDGQVDWRLTLDGLDGPLCSEGRLFFGASQ
ncbi:3-hydroxymyristoyl/3-hydroxydecanoyl-(acyl carrier protein) dehydratase [Natronospira proteinivora]|uniref:3-hydroxymyristoyl/3-hydroxydecanoyl-(Acyl carrier protein) dehydratase n=1 Tax=Natronospira proteinivora TaxID=1807133 RepID=A0ABT1G8V3_9GAMM|nr:hypothetical protein [Natronospira proteinivora]MCP1727725.1 3-hydroxymyristoyl/3-hydroxydecanoyl-(acyl carrier protein) dehydratase [Natronospira proteinivora]